MSVFVDTSAVIALLNSQDRFHHDADVIWAGLIPRQEPLLTTNYVLVELLSLVQQRNGMAGVQAVIGSICPVLQTEWVLEGDHNAAVNAVMAARRRDLSLVDCASFLVMRRLNIERCFTFDDHFVEAGFQPLSPA